MKRNSKALKDLFKISVATAAVVLFVAATTIKTPATPGDLDLTFGTNGRAVTSFFDRDHAFDMVVQPDGKFVIIGTTTADQWDDEDLLVARFHPNGNVDTSFGSSGKTSLDILGGRDYANAVALQADGKIVVAGSVRAFLADHFTDRFVVVRYNSDGSLDATFGNGGKVITDFFGFHNQANALLVQPDGKIVAAGFATQTAHHDSADFVLARYNADGSFDMTFGVGGKVITSFSNFPDIIEALALQPDGRIIAGGTLRLDGNFYRGDFALARYNADGSLDESFGTGGKVITDVTTSNSLIDQVKQLLVEPNGKIIAGGTARSLIFSGDKFAMARYNTDGTLDAGFGTGGRVSTSFSQLSEANAVVRQTNGKIILAGKVLRPYDHFADIAMARYHSDGSLDPTFGEAGRKIENLSAEGSDAAAAIDLQPDGRIMIAGIFSTQGNNSYDFMLARFIGDAVNQPTLFDFDGDGKTDVSVWRPSDGNWHLSQSTDGYANYTWGASGDQIAPGDFDGDGKADVVVHRSATGAWFILNSNDGTHTAYTWGVSGDVPVVGDYDDDGNADVAVYRPADGDWHIRRSSDGGYTNVIWGVAGDVPVAGDFDGDGQNDIAVRRPSTGEWFINRSTAGYISVTWGVGTDTPVHADYDGDQKDDIAVWRPSTGEWFILRSSDGGNTQSTWGATGDVPVPGDYDGDGKADISVVRNGTWHISQSTDGYRTTTWGVGTDVAIPGRY